MKGMRKPARRFCNPNHRQPMAMSTNMVKVRLRAASFSSEYKEYAVWFTYNTVKTTAMILTAV